MGNYEFLLATQNDRIVKDFKDNLSNRAIKLNIANLPAQVNKIFQKKGTTIEVLIVDLTLPAIDINKLVFYIRQHQKDIPVLLLQMNRAIEPRPKEKEIFRNLSVYGWIRKPSNKTEALAILEDFNNIFDLDMDKKFERVEFLEQENMLACTFKNGKTYFLNRKVIKEDDGSGIERISISQDSYYFIVYLESGKTYEIPWDVILYYCEEKYQFHKTKTREGIAANEIGDRVKTARERRRFTQFDLENKTGILRANIARIESGKHYPSLETLEKLAEGLEVPVYTFLEK